MLKAIVAVAVAAISGACGLAETAQAAPISVSGTGYVNSIGYAASYNLTFDPSNDTGKFTFTAYSGGNPYISKTVDVNTSFLAYPYPDNTSYSIEATGTDFDFSTGFYRTIGSSSLTYNGFFSIYSAGEVNLTYSGGTFNLDLNGNSLPTPAPLPASAPLLGAALLILGGAGYARRRSLFSASAR